jgi:hypothetical protein
LTFSHDGVLLTGESAAYGGYAGYGSGEVVGAPAGNADASINLTSIGSLIANAIAEGGNLTNSGNGAVSASSAVVVARGTALHAFDEPQPKVSSVSALARGGSGHTRAGTAQAEAYGTTFGEHSAMNVSARAFGSSGFSLADGTARAGLVEVHGRARAQFSGVPQGIAGNDAGVQVGVGANVLIAIPNALGPLAGSEAALALGVGLPAPVDENLLFFSPDVAGEFGSLGTTTAQILGLLAARHQSGVNQPLTASLELRLDAAAPAYTGLQIGLFNGGGPGFQYTGFNTLQFQVLSDGETLLDVAFADILTATTYFSDNLLSIVNWSAGADGELDVTFRMVMTGGQPTHGFAFNLVAGGVNPVPLPPTVWLLSSALAALSLRARQLAKHKKGELSL